MSDVPCLHENFQCRVDVVRLADDDKPLRFLAEVGVECSQCGTVFEFEGIDFHGFRFNGPSLGVFSYPLTVPIKPAEIQPKGAYMTEDLNSGRVRE